MADNPTTDRAAAAVADIRAHVAALAADGVKNAVVDERDIACYRAAEAGGSLSQVADALGTCRNEAAAICRRGRRLAAAIDTTRGG